MLICSMMATKFYSHVNYSVTKMVAVIFAAFIVFYSHVNYSVTKILPPLLSA